MQIVVHQTHKLRIAVGLEFAFLKIKIVVLVSYGEGVQLFAACGKFAVGNGGNDARIESPRKEGAHGHVGDKLALHRVRDKVAHLFHGLLEGVGKRAITKCPIAGNVQTVSVENCAVRGRQLADILKHTAAGRAPWA